MKKNKIDLASENTLLTVLKLCIPAMLGQFVNVLYSIIDRLYIGQIKDIGEKALGGIGVVAPLITMLVSFAYLIGIGGAPFMMRKLGEKDKKKAEKIMANSFLLLIILGVLIPTISFIFLDPLLLAVGSTSDMIEYSKQYMIVYLLGNCFALIATGLSQFISAQGYSKIAMIGLILGAIMNIALDPLFIFVFKLNVIGAALATIISQFATFIFCLVFLLSKKSNIRITFKDYDIKTCLEIIKYGASPFLIYVTDGLTMICIDKSISLHGGVSSSDMLVGLTITNCIYQLVSMPLLGVSNGTQGILSYNFGAGNTKIVKKAQKDILFVGLIFTTFSFIGLFFLITPISKIFTSNETVLKYAKQSSVLYLIGTLPLALQYCIVDGTTALGYPLESTLLSLSRKGIIILSSFILPLIFKTANSIFYSQMIGDIFNSFLCALIYIYLFPKILSRCEKHHQEMIEKQLLNN